MIKRYGHLFLAPLALLLQGFPVLFLYQIPEMTYGGNPVIPEERVWLLSVIVPLLSALCGITIASLASYRLLTRSRFFVAEAMILIFCTPAWFLSAIFLHGALVFLGWI